jgi:hypothetical protein
MGLRNTATIIALRSAVRLAWRIERIAQTLGDLGERLENAVGRQAERRQVNIDEVLEPLNANAPQPEATNGRPCAH